MDELYRLAAVEEIKQLRARYFRFVDTKNWAALRTLFCERALLDFADSNLGPQPLHQAMEFIRSSLAEAVSVHHGHMPEIEIHSESRAQGVWAMDDELNWPENSRSPLGILRCRGAGHYYESYEKHDGRWLIASLRLTRLRRIIELLPQRSPPD